MNKAQFMAALREFLMTAGDIVNGALRIADLQDKEVQDHLVDELRRNLDTFKEEKDDSNSRSS